MTDIKYLSENEINEFVTALDTDNDGCISYTELEQKLDHVYEELELTAKEHHLHHDSRRHDQRHEFLRRMMSTEKDAIPADEFERIVASWKIPSLEKEKKAAQNEDDYLKRIPWGRRMRSYWDVDGPNWLFLAVVVGFQVGLAAWQCVKYATDPQYQAALGWGVVFAKACAGALYPTLFFLVLSMSRWFATAMRRFYYVSRFVNWDRSKSFHIKMSIAGLLLSTGHAIGHLSGSFVFASQVHEQQHVASLLGPDAGPRPYITYVRTLPGWSGLTALGLYYAIALLSTPFVRKHSWEIFHLGHLLIYPLLGLLMAHGTLKLLQYPIMGFVVALPTLLVAIEWLTRIVSGIRQISAKLEVLDSDTIVITCTIPKRRIWRYKAGQYVFLQVRRLSIFQWHPFTISTCIGRAMTLHIKTDGDWTGKLRELKDLKHVSIDGPYGAPAQRFYDFDQTIIIGAGIGITPFSGILNDLQTRESHRWNSRRCSSFAIPADTTARVMTASDSDIEMLTDNSKQQPYDREIFMNERSNSVLPSGIEGDLSLYRRVDFHWIVRDKNHLLWFASLLNNFSSAYQDPYIDIRLHNHITKELTDISLHVFRWLLEIHRTPSQPISPLTGLIVPTQFGRPDFPTIMNQHYEDMQELFKRDTKRRRRVGVFYCGSPVIGRTLADLCRELTVRGTQNGPGIEYHFMIEVFG